MNIMLGNYYSVDIILEGSETSKKSRRLRQKSGEIFQEIWKSEIL